MSRHYSKVTSTVDLKRLDENARKENKKCVGLSQKGDLFTIDEGKSHRKISIEEAAKILETTPDEVQKLLDSQGDYQIKDPEPELPVIETVPENELEAEPEEAEIITEKSDVDNQEQHHPDVDHDRNQVLESKIDELIAANAVLIEAIKKLQETVENFYL